MEAHHDNHHNTYVDKLNDKCETTPELQGQTVTELVTGEYKDIAEVRKHAGGHYYHSLFWWILTEPNTTNTLQPGDLLTKIEGRWGTFEKFQEHFEDAATQLFGSGWTTLVDCGPHDGGLKIINKSHQNIPSCPFMLGLDVWEHAYYLDYKWKRSDYVANFWQVIDWPVVEMFYENYVTQGIYVQF